MTAAPRVIRPAVDGHRIGSVARATLQRACACGQHGHGEAECVECKKKQGMQRSARGTVARSVAPPVVEDVLRSPGRPLDPAARSFMEPRFGRDFSGVRVHADRRAAASADSVDARAFTIGQRIVFADGQFSPHTPLGRRLLAHELVHTVQQRGAEPASAAALPISHPGDASEREADRVANAVLSERGGHAVSPRPPGLARDKASDSPSKWGSCGSMAARMTAFDTGLVGTIEFLPDPKACPKCRQIRLVQAVRVFERPGVDYTFTGGEAAREKVKTAENTRKRVKANYFIDHLAAGCSAGKKCSIYYRDQAPFPDKSQDGSNDGRTAKKASLWDRPSGDADDVFEFETCARCVDIGAYLGCLAWGFTADSTGKTTASGTAEYAKPSATFAAALATFNKFYGNK